MSSAPARPSINGPLLLGLVLTAGACLRPILGLGESYGDNDDAMRLQAVRDLLNGQPWSDLVQHRMAPPAGLESHWSRLVDAPLALLLAITQPLLGQANSELFVRAIWPPLLFGLALWAILRTAHYFGGERAAWAAAVMAPLSGFIWMQFLPGRIDHHNVQLLLAAGMVLAATNLTAPRNAALIGAMAALSAAVGLEAIGVIAWSALVYFALLILRPEHARAARFYGLAFAGVGALAYVIQTPPTWLARMGCDALQLNGVAGIVLAGGGLALASLIAPRNLIARAALVGGAGLLAGAFALGLHPSCIHGPYADIDPRITTIWLPKVEEANSWLALLASRPIMAISAVTLPFGALVYAGFLIWRGERREWFLAATGLLFISTIVGLSQARGLSCATLVAIPIAAMGLSRLSYVQTLKPRFGGVLAGAIVSPALLYNGLMLVTPAHAGTVEQTANVADDCTKVSYFAALRDQPAGIVFADINSSAHILASTHHAVTGGPYHRLGQEIFEAMTAFHRTPEEAAATLARTGASYVALCRSGDIIGALSPNSFGYALLKDAPPPWAVQLTAPGAPVAIFRIVKGGT